MFRMNVVSCPCFSSVTIVFNFIQIKTFYFQPLIFNPIMMSLELMALIGFDWGRLTWML